MFYFILLVIFIKAIPAIEGSIIQIENKEREKARKNRRIIRGEEVLRPQPGIRMTE